MRLAQADERGRIERMMEPYLRGLGAPPGFLYPNLDAYWEDASRYPYVIVDGDQCVGFALVHRAGSEPACDLVEFYVAAEFRRRGLGREAAEALFELHPGSWSVAIRSDNPTGRAFWESVLSGYPVSAAETTRPQGVVYTFASKGGRAGIAQVPFAGGCACGAIRYECSAPPLRMLNCHCRDCQIASGGAFSPTVIMESGAVKVTRGQPAQFEKVAESGNIARRAFCRDCGTPLFASSSAGVEYLGIRAASLDDPRWFRPEANVWVRSAQPWDHLDPAIPAHEKNRPRSR